jgi:hypothetical protein
MILRKTILFLYTYVSVVAAKKEQRLNRLYCETYYEWYVKCTMVVIVVVQYNNKLLIFTCVDNRIGRERERERERGMEKLRDERIYDVSDFY